MVNSLKPSDAIWHYRTLSNSSSTGLMLDILKMESWGSLQTQLFKIFIFLRSSAKTCVFWWWESVIESAAVVYRSHGSNRYLRQFAVTYNINGLNGNGSLSISLALTHWPLEDLNEILYIYFQTDFSDWWLRYLLWNCPQMKATGPYWR